MSKRYTQELEEHAVRTVLECEKDYETRYGTVKAVANKVDIGNESLRGCSGHQRAPNSAPRSSTQEGVAHRPPGSASLSGDEADGGREVLSRAALAEGRCAPSGRTPGAVAAAPTAQDAGSHPHSSHDPDGDGGQGAEPGSWGEGRAQREGGSHLLRREQSRALNNVSIGQDDAADTDRGDLDRRPPVLHRTEA